MKRGALLIVLAVAAACAPPRATEPSSPWELVWSDEFEGTSLDTSKWNVELGSSFGTQQLDFDTARPENISLQGGHLFLTARREAYKAHEYTSGRITTKGKLSRTYGRFEARMKLPYGQGMWPAFWLLGAAIDEVGWPKCGEIDIVESRGIERSRVHGSLHGPGYSGGSALTRSLSLAQGQVFSDDFHVFAVEWDPGLIKFYVDDELYQTRVQEKMPSTQPWVFEAPFFAIVNLAVGGLFGGDPDETTVFPQSLEVDYVRVYTRMDEGERRRMTIR